MRPRLILLLTLIIASINIFGQVDFNVDLGLGISTPQLQKQTNSRTNVGQITPILGLYSSLNYKRFEFSTGIEASSSKDKSYGSSNSGDYENLYGTKTSLSKLSIPFSVGYNIKVGKVKVKPYVGVLYHLQMNLSEEVYSKSIINNMVDESSVKHLFSDNYYRDYFDRLQLLAGFEVKLTSKLSTNISIAFGEELYAYYYPHFGNSSILYCGLGSVAEISGNNYRITFNYSLSK